VILICIKDARNSALYCWKRHSNQQEKIVKKSIIAAAVLALAGVTLTVDAQNTKPTQKATPTTSAKKNLPSTAEFDKQLNQMQDELTKMQAQMDKLRQTQDPQERQQLLQEHWTTMQSAMTLMHGLGGPGMRGGGPGMGHGMRGGSAGMMGGNVGMGGGMMGWGNMSRYYSQLTPEQQKQRDYMVDQKLRVHQLMMEQMLEHQQALWQSQGATPAK
jgi:hypothetical protein